MDLSNLKPAEGSVKNQENALVEVKVLEKVVLLQEVTKELSLVLVILEKLGFEGGQMPLQRRVPKFGFTNINA